MEFLDQFDALIRGFIAAHHAWAGPIAMGLAFGESLAFIGILLPATAALVFIGVLISQGLLDFWTMALWATPGAAFGDWLSYWIGRKFDRAIGRVWPFSRYPEMLAKGHVFFERWGIASVFLGRFFGPVRAVIPLVAGIMDMPTGRFQLANWASACIWAPYWLAVGIFGNRLFDWLSDRFGLWVGLTLFGGLCLLGLGAWKWIERRRARTPSATN
jgi:membrane protein DedA with SNARE-associated domain